MALGFGLARIFFLVFVYLIAPLRSHHASICHGKMLTIPVGKLKDFCIPTKFLYLSLPFLYRTEGGDAHILKSSPGQPSSAPNSNPTLCLSPKISRSKTQAIFDIITALSSLDYTASLLLTPLAASMHLVRTPIYLLRIRNPRVPLRTIHLIEPLPVTVRYARITLGSIHLCGSWRDG